ncbi:MAG TPA: hypothetical protein PKZ26_04395 [Anaerolineaceae bacterium]|nr:hypothetical protein [Anaerolineaceae bacterium]HOQ69345.1 hypothetical protein [Anaerolineaceae bacterium]HUM62894.1 hypothetical protein [Anaerolineaceae bacterium]
MSRLRCEGQHWLPKALQAACRYHGVQILPLPTLYLACKTVS